MSIRAISFALFFFFLAGLSSCNDASSSATDTSATKEDKKSIEKYGLDAISFGMSRTEFNEVEIPEGYPIPLGKYGYAVKGYFNDQDQLYLLQIKGIPTSEPKQYTTAIYFVWEDLIDVFTLKYGRAVGEPKLYPPISYLENNRILFTHEWQSGTKRIQLGLLKKDGMFSAQVFIEDSNFKPSGK
ncbi:MAG: hypothetical protein R2798_01800 [Chitinophagales bacterium]|nr:hypothetical protein [Bacteroidota bacterium]MCB9042830.1 hypothetical protein [Chitinophagales bacterium]